MAWGHICVRRLLELSARAWSPTPLIRHINIHTHIEYAPNETHTHFFTLSPLPPTIGLLHDPRLCRPHHIKTWTNQPHTLMDTYPHTHTHTSPPACELHFSSRTRSQLVNSPNSAWTQSHGGYSLIKCGDCGEEQIKPWIRPNKQQDRLDLGIKRNAEMIFMCPLKLFSCESCICQEK